MNQHICIQLSFHMLFSSHCNKTENYIYLSKYIILDLAKSFSISTVSTEQFVEILQQRIYSILFYSTNQLVCLFTTLILMPGYEDNIPLSHAHFLPSVYMGKTLAMGFLDMFCIAVSLFTQEKRIELCLKQRFFFKKYIHYSQLSSHLRTWDSRFSNSPFSLCSIWNPFWI